MKSIFWKESNRESSVIYPIDEIMRRARLKLIVWDRDFPLTSGNIGLMPVLARRWRQLTTWKKNGIKQVKVYYDPTYYFRNVYNIELLDPLHLYNVKEYKGIK